MPPPALARSLYRGLSLAHRQVIRLDRVLAELAVSLHTPALERLASDAHYAATTIYRDPRNQRSGLYPFEIRALASHFPPPPARLLVPGAGGGREVLALLSRGHDIDAFEPVPPLVEAANRALAASTTRVTRSTLEQWSASAPSLPRYDGIFTGWGTWTHLIGRDARLAALRAFHRACPEGPVLLSFWRREKVFDPDEGREAGGSPPGSPAARLEALTRGVLRARLLGLPPVEPGTVWRAGLYGHCVSEAELREEAAASDYDVVHHERDGSRFPNAILMPTSTT